MAQPPINIPAYAPDCVKRLKCRHCLTGMKSSNVVAAGVFRGEHWYAFLLEVACDKCRKMTRTYMPEINLTAKNWARQIADSMPKRARRVQGPAPTQAELDPAPDAPVSRADERSEYFAKQRMVLACGAVNYDHQDGEPAVTITLGTWRGDVEPLVISIADARMLACELLVALAGNEDRHSQHLLDQYFPTDREGNFRWPSPQDFR